MQQPLPTLSESEAKAESMRMRFWTVSKGLSNILKMRKLYYLPTIAMITVGLSAQVSPAASDLSSNQEVIAFLTESIDWYRHCAIEHQIATDPVDLVFLQDNQPGAMQILQLSFDFARAGAQFSVTSQADIQKGSAGSATSSPDLAQFVQLKTNTELQSRQASEKLEAINKSITTAHGARRRDLQAALDATQSRLDVLQAGLATLRQLVEFMQAFRSRQTGDLASTIDDLARTVPDVTGPTTVVPQTQVSAASLSAKSGDAGILALSSEVSALGRKLGILDDEIGRTDTLRQSSEQLRNPLLVALNKHLPALAENALQGSDPAELQRQKTRLDELAALVKTLSPAIVALDKQRVLLDAYTSRLKSWRAAVIAEDKKTWKDLISRLLGAAVVIGSLVIIGAVVRRVTRRHMRDTERRHIALVIQRVALWSTIVAVAAFAFASDLTSLATFFGLLAAGVAVALQSVVLSAVGYFVLVGKRGIRIGDRVQISGVTGDVTDIGWLQFHLREIDTRTQQPTGNVVTFSNSFVLASPATGLSKFKRNDLTSAQLEVAAKGSQS
jgi:ABC-type Fe3+-siderophore transport system permease subunit